MKIIIAISDQLINYEFPAGRLYGIAEGSVASFSIEITNILSKLLMSFA